MAKIHQFCGYMTRSAVLLKPNVANIVLYNFCKQKFVQHAPIMITIDCNGHFLLIFEEKCPNYATGLKFLRRPFSVCVWVFCAPNVKIGIFCKSIACPLSEAKTHWMLNFVPIGLFMASYQGLYAKFVSMMSPKYLIVENDGELMLMTLHSDFLP